MTGRNGSVYLRFALLVTAIALSLSACAYADSEYDGILSQKHWSLQFDVGQDFQLSNFDGYMIALKKQTSERRAWRLGGSVTGKLGKETNPSGVETRAGGWREHDFGMDLDVIRLYYSKSTSRAKFYYGFGPTASFEFAEWKTRQEPYGYVRTTATGVGAMALAGVEYFLSHSISITAEYGVILEYTYQDHTNDYQGIIKSTSEDSMLSLESRPVLFGLTAYF